MAHPLKSYCKHSIFRSRYFLAEANCDTGNCWPWDWHLKIRSTDLNGQLIFFINKTCNISKKRKEIRALPGLVDPVLYLYFLGSNLHHGRHPSPSIYSISIFCRPWNQTSFKCGGSHLMSIRHPCYRAWSSGGFISQLCSVRDSIHFINGVTWAPIYSSKTMITSCNRFYHRCFSLGLTYICPGSCG